MSGTDNEGIRLNKYIASSGLCSRREADTLIENGKVKINGVIALQGSKVNPGDIVEVSGRKITPDDDMIYIAFNKPLGVTCTTDRRDPSNIIDYIGFDERIFPVGRLDKNSSGLILLTNDGSIVNKLLRAENGHEKEYLVTVNRPYDKAFINSMESGVPVLGQLTLPCRIKPAGDKTFKIILRKGLNRQIRRMTEACGEQVTFLKRIRVMNIKLDNLEIGKYRECTQKEIDELKQKVYK